MNETFEHTRYALQKDGKFRGHRRYQYVEFDRARVWARRQDAVMQSRQGETVVPVTVRFEVVNEPAS